MCRFKKNNINLMSWRKLNGIHVGTNIVEIVRKTIKREQDLGYTLKVCIGTDSQVYKTHIEFATVVVFLREGSGGFMFIKNYKHIGNLGLKERMIIEVSKSIDVAYSICPIIESSKVDFEVHADINTNPQFKSNTALSEAMGYIMSMGFEFKAKPEAFASSSCADKVV